ncbi:MerR family transcriptional regulator [Pseudoruegeria sp. HB172150]|uniref:MerR family transcriptional regulator n=1 Tax=Pseudoruegeria sp. HB172150 TaxID=2721164 RepID=UPI0015554B06|nr:MerR family transcriptional regulator [Pseudoruegeria sp. HB172150]
MKISKAAKACGLSADTIRFYEKSGMLPDIPRGPDGHRDISAKDIDWLTLLYWLRETGMPLKQMKRFTALAKAGDAGVAERRQILRDHSAELGRRRALLDRCEEVLAIKIASYGEAP